MQPEDQAITTTATKHQYPVTITVTLQNDQVMVTIIFTSLNDQAIVTTLTKPQDPVTITATRDLEPAPAVLRPTMQMEFSRETVNRKYYKLITRNILHH